MLVKTRKNCPECRRAVRHQRRHQGSVRFEDSWVECTAHGALRSFVEVDPFFHNPTGNRFFPPKPTTFRRGHIGPLKVLARAPVEFPVQTRHGLWTITWAILGYPDDHGEFNRFPAVVLYADQNIILEIDQKTFDAVLRAFSLRSAVDCVDTAVFGEAKYRMGFDPVPPLSPRQRTSCVEC